MAKKILVVGGGGREHAIIKALKKTPSAKTSRPPMWIPWWALQWKKSSITL